MGTASKTIGAVFVVLFLTTPTSRTVFGQSLAGAAEVDVVVRAGSVLALERVPSAGGDGEHGCGVVATLRDDGGGAVAGARLSSGDLGRRITGSDGRARWDVPCPGKAATEGTAAGGTAAGEMVVRFAGSETLGPSVARYRFAAEGLPPKGAEGTPIAKPTVRTRVGRWGWLWGAVSTVPWLFGGLVWWVVRRRRRANALPLNFTPTSGWADAPDPTRGSRTDATEAVEDADWVPSREDFDRAVTQRFAATLGSVTVSQRWTLQELQRQPGTPVEVVNALHVAERHCHDQVDLTDPHWRRRARQALTVLQQRAAETPVGSDP